MGRMICFGARQAQKGGLGQKKDERRKSEG